MVDRVLELEEGRRIVSVKNVTINEPYFQGHYSVTPVMPGVMIVEAMAQAGEERLSQKRWFLCWPPLNGCALGE